MTIEQKKHIDAFEYWVKTNTENGVSILPESICKDIIAILRDKDGDAEMNMTLEDAIVHAEDTAKSAIGCECREEHRQLAEWLKILKKAKFEYDEAWRIITHPTPDVTSYDKTRAQVILETFRGSLGKIEYES